MMLLLFPESHLMDFHCLAMQVYLCDKQQIHTFRDETEIWEVVMLHKCWYCWKSFYKRSNWTVWNIRLCEPQRNIRRDACCLQTVFELTNIINVEGSTVGRQSRQWVSTWIYGLETRQNHLRKMQGKQAVSWRVFTKWHDTHPETTAHALQWLLW